MSEKTPQSWLTDYLPPGSLPTNNNLLTKPAQEDNAMNKSVTSLWNLHKSTPTAVTQSGNASPIVNNASGTATPVDVSTPVNEELPVVPNAATSATKDGTTKSKKRSKSGKDSGSSSKRPKSKISKCHHQKTSFY